MFKLFHKAKRWLNMRVYGSKRPWLLSAPCEQVFTYIHDHNVWGDPDSVSGVGSNLEQTRVVRELLPRLMNELDIEAILDIPCGDFYWMSRVDLTGKRYLGADVVLSLVQSNQARHGRLERGASIRFEHLNLLESDLPRVDLVFCRDCMVHFCNKDVRRALAQIKRSGSSYLLTTTYPSRENKDIATGDWRALNLQAAPFLLPSPVRLIGEGCSERNGRYTDKSLGLWRVADLPEMSAFDAR